MDTQEALAIGFAHPPVFAPGTGCDDSNTNYALVGLIIEKVDAKPLGQAFRDRLFGLQGPTGTSFPAPTDTSIPAPIRAPVGGRVLGSDIQRQWLDSPAPAEPGAPQYGLGIERQVLAPNAPLSHHFGEMAGYNAFAGYDPVDQWVVTREERTSPCARDHALLGDLSLAAGHRSGGLSRGGL